MISVKKKMSEANLAESPISLKMDLTHFKNDTLKEVKTLEKSLTESFKKSEANVQQKIEELDKKMLEYSQKIDQVDTLVIESNDMKQKMEQMNVFKDKAENSIVVSEYRIKTLEKDQQETLYSMNNFLNENILYTGIIGTTGKFKTFHNFIDYVLQQLFKDDKFREEMTIDYDSFKSKYDTFTTQTAERFGGLYEKVGNYIKKDIETTLKDYDEKMQDIFKEYNDKIKKMNNEFDNYFIQNNNIITDIKKQIKDCFDIQNELFEKIEDINKKNSFFNSEIDLIKDKSQSIITGIKNAGLKNERGQKIKFNFGDDDNKQIRGISPKKVRYFFNGENNRKQTKLKTDRSIDGKPGKETNRLSAKNSNGKKLSTVTRPFAVSNQLLNKNNSDLQKNKNQSSEHKHFQTDNSEINIKKMKLLNNQSYNKNQIDSINIGNNSNRSNSNNNFITQTNNFEIGEYSNNKTKNENTKEYNQKLNDKIDNNNLNTISNFNFDNKDNVDNTIYKIKGKIFQNNTPKHNISLQNSLAIKKNNIYFSGNKDQCLLSQPLEKISINIEGQNSLEINPRKAKSNSKMQSFISSLNNIIHDNDYSKKNTALLINNSGYPRIISNHGQQIMISTRPMFHSNKFCHYKNPRLNELDSNIKTLYESFKGNEQTCFKKASFDTLKKPGRVLYIDGVEKKLAGFNDDSCFNDEKIRGYKNKLFMHKRDNDNK